VRVLDGAAFVVLLLALCALVALLLPAGRDFRRLRRLRRERAALARRARTQELEHQAQLDLQGRIDAIDQELAADRARRRPR